MTKRPNYVFDDELYHHGIPGQRWRHRRFQYEDGSWTPEGRERYGKGGAREKSDVQKYKAKVSYKTQQYKENLKSKAQKNRDVRRASEERNRVKEWAKTERFAKKEQIKIDKIGKNSSFNLGKSKSKNMSKEDLNSEIERLKLVTEYNKIKVLADNPDSALAKADRFFEGPTGKMVRDIAVATIPDITKYAVNAALNKSSKLDIEAKKASIEQTKANARKANAEAAAKEYTNANKEEHDRKVKERAERMFGNKNPSSNSNGNKIEFSKEDFIQPNKKKKKK